MRAVQMIFIPKNIFSISFFKNIQMFNLQKMQQIDFSRHKKTKWIRQNNYRNFHKQNKIKSMNRENNIYKKTKLFYQGVKPF